MRWNRLAKMEHLNELGDRKSNVREESNYEKNLLWVKESQPARSKGTHPFLNFMR